MRLSPNVRCMAINKRNLFELLKIDLVLKNGGQILALILGQMV